VVFWIILARRCCLVSYSPGHSTTVNSLRNNPWRRAGGVYMSAVLR